MYQAIIKKGSVFGEKVPAPELSKGHVLIKVINSCISAGTEMKSVNNSSKPLIRRAIDQPDHLKKIIEMVKSEGLQKTLSRVKGKIGFGQPTGYSVSGVVIASACPQFNIGDKVAAAGAGLANHAELVLVPEKLVVKLPKNLSYELGSTVTLGAIALQGVRRADLRLGEYAYVVGAGILGLLAIQMLKLSGIRVIASDIDNQRLHLAKELGADLVLNPDECNVVESVRNFTGGAGADCSLFTAATSSSEPLSQAFNACRRKGKLVLIGMSGMNIKREDIYAKELDFQISTSYGPGRYDPLYEEEGVDYPYAYVRWTENRNMLEYLRMLAEGKITVSSMITKRFNFSEVDTAFKILNSKEEKPLIVLLRYDHSNTDDSSFLLRTINVQPLSLKKKNGNETVGIGLVGVGGFAKGMHLPNLQKLNKKYSLEVVMSRKGFDAKVVAQQYGATIATTNFNEVISNHNVNLVMITTRHSSHGEYVLKALQAGKNVFVEKPLAISRAELTAIKNFYSDYADKKNMPLLFVGYNRRFSPFCREIKDSITDRDSPLLIRYRMNAGTVASDHWVHREGGRIIGEACHLIDLMTYLVGCEIASIYSESLSPEVSTFFSSSDNKTITLKYTDGSVAIIDYFSVGSKSLSKEYMEVHFDGKSIIMDDYKSIKGYGVKVSEKKFSTPRKGQYEELDIVFASLVNGGEWPIPLWDLLQTTEATFMVENI